VTEASDDERTDVDLARLDSSGALVEEKFPASPTSYPASPTTCRTVVYKVTATELFTPYDALGHDLTGESLGTSPTWKRLPAIAIDCAIKDQ